MPGRRLLWGVARAGLQGHSYTTGRCVRSHSQQGCRYKRNPFGSSFSSQAGAESFDSSQQQGQRGVLYRLLSLARRSVQGKSNLLAVAGAGCVGAGLYVVLADAGQDAVPSAAEVAVTSGEPRKKKVIILGTGWAGMSFLKSLDSTLYDVLVVSPRNYFVFTPLLPGVTSGTVEARSITEPIRRIIRQRHVQFHEAECMKIDAKNKKIICKDVSNVQLKGKEAFELQYDYLVVGVGALSNTFGTKGVKEYCHLLKEIEDAERIRESIVDCFETASLPHISVEDRYCHLSLSHIPV